MTHLNSDPPAGRVVRTTAFAGPDSIDVVDLPTPRPKRGEVLVAVQASSATTSDSIVRRGLNPYLGDLEPPFTLGYDLVGHVIDVGDDVATFSVGDRVVAVTRWGSNADFAIVSAAKLTRIDSDLDATLIEPMVMTGATAAAMVRRLAPVKPGQTVYVQGASGAVGYVAVQAALLLGARVIGSASPAKHGSLSALGATMLDYRSADLVDDIRGLAPLGVDLAVDAAGGDGLARAGQTLAAGGTLISFGFAEAARRNLARSPQVIASTTDVFAAAAATLASINASPSGTRAVQFDITTLREQDPAGYEADLFWLLDQVESDRLNPVVTRVGLADAAEAHRALDAGAVTGRLVFDHSVT